MTRIACPRPEAAVAARPKASRARRRLLVASAGIGATLLVRSFAWAQTTTPAGGLDELAAAINKYSGGKPVLPGKVKLEISSIIDNGNSVPVTISVDSPMTPAAHVKGIALFNERNPQRDVVTLKLGPRAARPVFSTRIRLATSQKLVAVAELSDGTFWSQGADVIVALAACIE